MAKRVFLVHGWGGSPETDFFIWLKNELGNRGFSVEAPAMPDTETPVIEKWVPALEKAVGEPDSDTYFIGHSIGCQTIIRYMEKANQRAGGALFIAGWFYLKGMEEAEESIARPWTENPINCNKVKENLGKISVLLSDDDPYDCLDENVRAFKDELGADVTVKRNMGHFNDPKYEFILDEFMKLIK